MSYPKIFSVALISLLALFAAGTSYADIEGHECQSKHSTC